MSYTRAGISSIRFIFQLNRIIIYRIGFFVSIQISVYYLLFLFIIIATFIRSNSYILKYDQEVFYSTTTLL